MGSVGRTILITTKLQGVAMIDEYSAGTDNYEKTGLIDKVSGAVLAFRTDLTEWQPEGECLHCGAVTFRKYDYENTIYETRCLNCGATGTGGPVDNE